MDIHEIDYLEIVFIIATVTLSCPYYESKSRDTTMFIHNADCTYLSSSPQVGDRPSALSGEDGRVLISYDSDWVLAMM